MRRQVSLYYGPTGTGKTFRAYNELGDNAYFKDPRTKWWSGYRGQDSVIIDEFRGAIDIAHILRWTDQYPVLVEPKHDSVPLRAKRFIFTSNLPIEQWYPDLDGPSLDALRRRFNVIEHLTEPYVSNVPSTPVIEAHEDRMRRMFDIDGSPKSCGHFGVCDCCDACNRNNDRVIGSTCFHHTPCCKIPPCIQDCVHSDCNDFEACSRCSGSPEECVCTDESE